MTVFLENIDITSHITIAELMRLRHNFPPYSILFFFSSGNPTYGFKNTLNLILALIYWPFMSSKFPEFKYSTETILSLQTPP